MRYRVSNAHTAHNTHMLWHTTPDTRPLYKYNKKVDEAAQKQKIGALDFILNSFLLVAIGVSSSVSCIPLI